jgi:ABC-type branched-subunit amino acid transport system permease subunit
LPVLLAFVLGGLSAALVGIAFGLPSLRIAASTWPPPRWRRSSSWSGA